MQPIVYQNFDLYIDSLPQGGYRAKVTSSPCGQAEDRLQLEDASAAGFPPWSAARPFTAAPASQVADLLAAANLLFAPLLAGAAGGLLARSLDAVRAAGQGLRLRLHLDAGAPLAALPWELLPDPGGDRFLALDPLTPIVRYLDLPAAARPLPGAHPVRVLAVLSSPTDLPPIPIEQAWEDLSAALAPLSAQGLVDVVRLPSAEVETLGAYLRSHACHVLHFIGHGLLDARQGEGALAFCRPAASARIVGAAELAILLGGQRELRLVFLNACHGAATHSDASAGVAQGLVKAGLPVVIAMQGAVEVPAAQVLAQVFYDGVANDLPVEAALGEARKAVLLRASPAAASRTAAGRAAAYDWALPVLFSRADDNALIARGGLLRAEAPAQIATLPFEPQTVLIPAGVFRMGRPAGEGATPGESPLHEVALKAFRIGCTPVTNAHYAHFARETRQAVAPEMGWQLAAIGQAPPAGRENHPVVGVSWDDAVAYCRWLSTRTGRRYRLPSEAEWERAARGVDGRLYPWGNDFDAQRCNAAASGRGQTSAVGEFSPQGDTPEGVADLAGNVWEWTGTRWGRDAGAAEYTYPYHADDGRENPAPATGPLREYHIRRGGCFQDGAERVTGSARSHRLADSRSRQCGLRVVMEVE